MLKMTGERLTIWERNFQLAFYSVLLLTGMAVYSSVTAETKAEGVVYMIEPSILNISFSISS
jgi:hypothetical protein